MVIRLGMGETLNSQRSGVCRCCGRPTERATELSKRLVVLKYCVACQMCFCEGYLRRKGVRRPDCPGRRLGVLVPEQAPVERVGVPARTLHRSRPIAL
jgi:hypothetical protein